MRGAVLVLVLGVVACNAIVGFQNFEKTPNPKNGTSGGEDDDDDTGTSSSSSGQSGSGEAGVDSGPGPVGTTCDDTKDFGAPVRLNGPINDTSFSGHATFTTDELTVVIERATNSTDSKVAKATRTSLAADFGAPATITELAGIKDHSPGLRTDGLFLFWGEAVEAERQIIMFATRPSATSMFESPQPFDPLSTTTADDSDPFPTADGIELFFSSDRAGGFALHHMTAKANGWNAPAVLTELQSNGDETRSALSHDGLTIYFSSSRSGGAGKHDIYEAKRPDRASKFANIKPMTSLNSAQIDMPSYVSKDKCRLYMTRASSSTVAEIMVATRPR